MNASPLSTHVLSLVANQLSLNEEDVRVELRLAEDLGADALDVVELVMEIEEQFNIEIEDDDVEKFITVQDIVTYLNAHLPAPLT